MDVKVRAAVAAGFEGISILQLAAELGVSRRWIYELQRRFEADGLEGLEPRSRRPNRSPQQMSAVVEDRIVRLPKELEDGRCCGTVLRTAHGATCVVCAALVVGCMLPHTLMSSLPSSAQPEQPLGANDRTGDGIAR